MAQQMPNLYRLSRMGVAKFRDIAGERAFQVDRPSLCQLQNCQGRKGFGDGGQAENGVFVYGKLVLRVPPAEEILV